MGKRMTGRFDDDEVAGLSRLMADREIEHESEAVRIATRAGLQQLDYAEGGDSDTHLRRTARRFGDAFALTALLLGAAMFLYPMEVRAFVIAPVAMALACWALDRGLATLEPSLSKRLVGFVGRGGEKA